MKHHARLKSMLSFVLGLITIFHIYVPNNVVWAEFGVDANVDPDLLTKSSDCLNDCLKKGNTFCQSKDTKESGYCCDKEDCSKYGEDFGLCSN